MVKIDETQNYYKVKSIVLEFLSKTFNKKIKYSCIDEEIDFQGLESYWKNTLADDLIKYFLESNPKSRNRIKDSILAKSYNEAKADNTKKKELIQTLVNEITDIIFHWYCEKLNTSQKISNNIVIERISDVLSDQYGKLEKDIAEVTSEKQNSNFNNVYKISVQEDFKEYFVETAFYKNALNSLKEYPVVILLGMPGAGKTHTSKRICLEYEENDYSVFYSDEGNIGSILKYIQECKKEKILVVLNDFLGQFYMDLNMSETGEFGQLISYIRTKKDIRLLVNSRNTIYKEAFSNRKFNDAIDNNWKSICELHVEEFSFEEKASILYNHLKRAYKNGNLTKEQCNAVIKDRKYVEILFNEKFNPRIIEYVTTGKKVTKILPQEYLAFIKEKLDFPETIWKEEYEKLNTTDRIFINTLYSLTKTCVSKDILKSCFDNRIKNQVEIKDTTINHFDSSLHRLSDSMIQVTISEGKEKIGVLNPSINAFIHESLPSNENEVEEIIKYALYIDQLERFESLECAKNQIIDLVNSGQYKKLATVPRQVFGNISSEFTPPHFMYTLKLLLFVLDEYGLQKIGAQKTDIQGFVLDIFINRTQEIEAHSRLYFANEFSNIFCKLFSESGILDYDFTEIVVDETYLQIIMNSVARQSSFWKILSNIQKKYYLYSEDRFYSLKSVKRAATERIEIEVIDQIYDGLLKEIDDIIENNRDSIDDFIDIDDFISYINEEVYYQVYDTVSDTIIDKLAAGNINYLSIDDFDISIILCDQIDLYDLIETECNKISYDDTSTEHKEEVEKTANTILSIFSVDFF